MGQCQEIRGGKQLGSTERALEYLKPSMRIQMSIVVNTVCLRKLLSGTCGQSSTLLLGGA